MTWSVGCDWPVTAGRTGQSWRYERPRSAPCREYDARGRVSLRWMLSVVLRGCNVRTMIGCLIARIVPYAQTRRPVVIRSVRFVEHCCNKFFVVSFSLIQHPVYG